MRSACLLVVGVLVVAGCSTTAGDPTTSTSQPTTTTTVGTSTTAAETSTTSGVSSTTTTTEATTTTTTGVEPVGEARTDPFESDGFPGTGEIAFLTDVRLGRHGDFTRVVFEFEDAIPEFTIRYIEPPVIESPSGREIDVAGEGFLQVTMSPASGVDLSGDEPEETYTGPDRIDGPDGSTIAEVVRTEDFEAVMSWVIGTEDHRLPYSFATLDDPHRLVIDVHDRDG